MPGLIAALIIQMVVFLASVAIVFGIIFYLGRRSAKKFEKLEFKYIPELQAIVESRVGIVTKMYEDKLNILRRYHGGDGTVTKEDVMKALGK